MIGLIVFDGWVGMSARDLQDFRAYLLRSWNIVSITRPLLLVGYLAHLCRMVNSVVASFCALSFVCILDPHILLCPRILLCHRIVQRHRILQCPIIFLYFVCIFREG